MVTIPGRSRKGATNDMVLRDSMFAGAGNRLWQPLPSVGFVMIPKTLPFIVRILDEITKGKPVGRAYSVLWTFCWNNDAFIKMSRAKDIAYACGYTGPRGVRLLIERLVKLRELGMIETASGTDGDISFIYLPCPHYSLLRVWLNGAPKIQERSFNAFRERATALGAKDVIAMLKTINEGGALSPITVAPPPAPPAPSLPPAVPVCATGFAVPLMPGVAPSPPVGSPVVPPGFFVGESTHTGAPPAAAPAVQDDVQALLDSLGTVPAQVRE
ncbi:MAG: hypothetical protein K2Z25_16385 [Beijerinckiaceae bacterium]|nr:hypothetical protein [Beijerinckiaceae bacterium]